MFRLNNKKILSGGIRIKKGTYHTNYIEQAFITSIYSSDFNITFFS